MDLLWEGLLTQLPSELITAILVGVTTWTVRVRARRRKSAGTGEQ